ncbi:hypothetical protein TNCV_1804711 [Trichonephila clavipes]|nr:hypothetical protein TNCV_1804711 [Trichonephila clavipes]
MVILRDNEPIRTAEELQSFQCENLDTSPQTHIVQNSSLVKKFLSGQRFTCSNDAKAGVRRWLHSWRNSTTGHLKFGAMMGQMSEPVRELCG